MSSSCEIYLVRHGQTDWNAAGRLQGHTDIPLNQEGEQEAFSLKEKLKHISFGAAFSSDLQRALKTAEIVVDSKLTITATTALRECFMGSWEGRLLDDLRPDFQFRDNLVNHSYERFLSHKMEPSFESHSEVYDRVITFVKQHAGVHDSIFLSSHAGVLRTILYHLDYRPGFHWKVANCAYIRLKVQGDEIVLTGAEGVKLVGGD